MAGVKGKSGRKTARKEFADLKKLHNMFFGDQSQAKIEKKIGRGVFSLRDRMILNGMEGDSAVLINTFKKMYPDSLDLTSGGKPFLIGLDEA